MITELFLGRLAARDPHQRVQVIGPLARAFLCPDLSAVSREEIGAGFAAILTDPNPIVRRALAEALADSPDAPHHLVAALAFDQLAVSAPVLRRSPVLQDHDLVELIGEGVAQTQMLIAGRSRISPPVAAALIEIAPPEVCELLLANPGADILSFSFARLAERHAGDAALRAAMLERDDLPAQVRQGLTLALAEALLGSDMFKAFVLPERGQKMVRDCCDQATVDLAGRCSGEERRALIVHLDCTGHLTAGLMLRALLHGNAGFFEDALAFLADLPPRRAARLAGGGQGAGFKAVYEKAGLPEAQFSAFATVLSQTRAALARGEDLTQASRRRALIEEVQAAFQRDWHPASLELSAMLTRLADAAAREEAKVVYWEDAAAA